MPLAPTRISSPSVPAQIELHCPAQIFAPLFQPKCLVHCDEWPAVVAINRPSGSCESDPFATPLRVRPLRCTVDHSSQAHVSVMVHSTRGIPLITPARNNPPVGNSIRSFALHLLPLAQALYRLLPSHPDTPPQQLHHATSHLVLLVVDGDVVPKVALGGLGLELGDERCKVALVLRGGMSSQLGRSVLDRM